MVFWVSDQQTTLRILVLNRWEEVAQYPQSGAHLRNVLPCVLLLVQILYYCCYNTYHHLYFVVVLSLHSRQTQKQIWQRLSTEYRRPLIKLLYKLRFDRFYTFQLSMSSIPFELSFCSVCMTLLCWSKSGFIELLLFSVTIISRKVAWTECEACVGPEKRTATIQWNRSG